MKNRKNLTLIAFIAVIAIAFSLGATPGAYAQSGLTLHETTTGTGMGQGGGTQNVTNYFTENAIKRTLTDGSDTVILLNKGKIISIDHKKKTYSEVTFEQIQALMDKLPSEMGQNQEGMEAMRKMMGQKASSFSVSKLGPGEKIAGYATEHYMVKGPMEMEIWAAPDVKVPTQYYDAMKMRMPRSPFFDMGKLYDEMKKINGMTLKSITTINMMGREMKTTTVVNSVEKGSIPASAFEIPAGYKLVADKMMK